MDNAPHTYIPAIRAALPRVLSMLNREPLSTTYGCADRVFWSWKFTDFPGARFQEIAYVLASLLTQPELAPSNAFSSATLLRWLKATTNFWRSLQHRDGSFDEAYPFERSLAATAFTGFYVGQAFLKAKHLYSLEEQTALHKTFYSAGEWLCRNDERHGVLSNHLAAAAAALNTIAEITSEQQFAERRNHFINRILSHQSDEGWYEEYGGADPGYQTHTTFYLGHVWLTTRDHTLLESLARSIRYFWYFVHVDGSIGGEYGSRNTRFFMPAGFEILAGMIPEAAAVAAAMRMSLQHEQAVGLHAMDTYNIFPLLNNYLFATQHTHVLDASTLPPLPHQTSGITSYPHSGHIVVVTPHYQAIIATSKGGVISAFAKAVQGESLWTNAGILLEFTDGKKASSQGLGCSEMRRISDTEVEITSYFTEINQMIMSPIKFIGFRLVSVCTAPAPAFAYALKKLLVKVLVRRKKRCPVRLMRNIRWDAKTISVTDTLFLEGQKAIKSVLSGGRFSAIHMGSARYFEWQELAQKVMPAPVSSHDIDQLNTTHKLVITSHWSA